jgi:hypothetical protein
MRPRLVERIRDGFANGIVGLALWLLARAADRDIERRLAEARAVEAELERELAARRAR